MRFHLGSKPALMLFLFLAVACGPKQGSQNLTAEEEAAKKLRAQKQYTIGQTLQAEMGGDGLKWDGPNGLQFSLSNATVPPTPRPVPTVSVIDDARAQELLKKLPDLPEAETSAFALRSDSRKPPIAGADKKVSFPPAAELKPPPGVKAGKAKENLTVIRNAPVGEVNMASDVRVTFSQPMVAVSDLETVDSTAPVTITPKVGGTWQWVDTRTAKYKPNARMPMATTYKVTVPKGTKSALGAVSRENFTFEFMTPPPRMMKRYPYSGSPQRTDVPMFVAFDQKVEPARVMGKLRVTAGGKAVKIRQMTAQEIEANADIRALVKDTRDGFWLAFKATSDFPKDTPIQVVIGKDTPSADGPRVTTREQSYDFRTYGPLSITRGQCYDYEGRCFPGDSFFITFTNTLDAALFAESMVTLNPVPEELAIRLQGNVVEVRGQTVLGTTYTVTVDPSIQDIFGQKLTGKNTLSFTVTERPPYPPQLYSFGGMMTVLDPVGDRAYTIISMNHDALELKLHKVDPKDYPAFLEYYNVKYGWDASVWNTATMPGELVLEKTLEPGGAVNEAVETRIDLSEALGTDGLGHVVIEVVPKDMPSDPYYRQQAVSWVQSTNMGVTAISDPGEVIGWVTDISDGKPLSGASVELVGGTTAKTDASGLATVTGTGSMLVARKGKDSAFIPEDSWTYRYEDSEYLAWYVVNDRQLYRPNETVSIKGWYRVVENSEGGEVRLLGEESRKVSWKAYDSTGSELGKGEAEVTALEGFSFTVDLPDDANLGWAYVELFLDGVSLNGNYGSHSFQIEEFRRPEFEVSAMASEGPHVVGTEALVTVAAGYFSGGPLGDAETQWTVSSSTAFYQPPNHDTFAFGEQYPWWYDRDYGGYYGGGGDYQNLSAKTDREGEHKVRVTFESVNPPQPSTIYAEARVTDVNRQAWAASTSFIVHPSKRYVGLKAERSFVVAGDSIGIDSIVTTIDGALSDGSRVEIRGVRREWTDESGSWQQVDRDPQTCRFTSGSDATRCNFTTTKGGPHLFRATVWDAKERPNQTAILVWVAGEAPISRDVNLEAVTLMSDKPTYIPGETAEVLVQAPWYPAEGIATINRLGVVSTHRFRLEGPSHTLTIPIQEGYVPNVNVHVELLGKAPRLNADYQPDDSLPPRAAYASGSIDLSIPPLTRELSVQLTPDAEVVSPGTETSVTVEVKNIFGEPVENAEVALVVVDESVLALTGYRFPSPLGNFYPHRYANMSWTDLRSYLLLEDPRLVEQLNAEAQAAPGAMGGMGGGGGGAKATRSMAIDFDDASGEMPMEAEEMAMALPSPSKKKSRKSKQEEKKDSSKESPEDSGSEEDTVELRKNFTPLAVFEPASLTDGKGRATVSFTMPDNLTRYRVMAVAVEGSKYYGLGESNITARLQLMVRPSPPRFLNFGDTFELPVVIQNLSSEEVEVEIAARASNASLTAGLGRKVKVAAQDRVEVRFPASAELPGRANFQVVASATTGKARDAAFFELPVWTPATTEAFAVYGEIDKDGDAIVQPIERPKDVVKSYGGVEVTTSSTQLHALTDAMVYLVNYPYSCSEQISSRMLGVTSLKDVLDAFEADGLPSPAAMIASVGYDIKLLRSRQNWSGGFGYWNQDGDAYLSVHVTHALTRAQQKGFAVDADMMNRALDYVRNIDSHFSKYYSERAKDVVRSYALYVRTLNGEALGGEAKKIIDRVTLKKLPLEATGWLLYALSKDPGAKATQDAVITYLNNRVTETAATAEFSNTWSDEEGWVILHSSRKADAVILESLITAKPDSDLITKVVRGLLAHRRKGRWYNTQENAFVLVGLDAYFQAFEKVDPNFVARVWLGEQYAGEAPFKERSTDRYHIDIPMSVVVDGDPVKDLILAKEGEDGRLYYRIGMKYAPSDLKIDPLDRGFIVERQYESVDDPGDVTRLPDGTWKVKSGARVRVRLKMVATGRRYFVALVDKLPAGFEPLNPTLAMTESVPSDTSADPYGYDWWARYWFVHQNLRDERVEAFTNLLWAGEYTYTYVARATTPGAFVVPPAKAEEMYFPETFGRSASTRVVVE